MLYSSGFNAGTAALLFRFGSEEEAEIVTNFSWKQNNNPGLFVWMPSSAGSAEILWSIQLH